MKLLVSHHSVLSTSMRAGGYYHYSLLWLIWLVGKLEQSKPGKQSCSEKFAYGYRFQVAFKNSHDGNTFPTPSQTTVALRFLYYRDPLDADDGSRKNSTDLECQPGGNNEVNDATVREFRTGAGGK